MRVAVVGASVAGLAAGALLARRGCQVTVFEASVQPEGPGEAPGLSGMNRVPGDHLIWGWRSSRPLMRLFGALKDRPGATARSLLQPVPTGLQVLGHPHRLDWGERLSEEVGREFPAALPAWRTCLAEWEREAETLQREDIGHPFLPSLQRSTEQILDAMREEASDALGKEHQATGGTTLATGAVEELPAEMWAYVNGFAQAVGWRPLEEVGLPAGLWALEMLGKEAAVLREGVEGLGHWLVGRLEAAGGSLRWGARVRSVKLRSRRVRGIVVKEGRSRSTTPVEGVVVAGGELVQLLPLGRFRAPRRRIVGTLVTCLIAVEDEVVPEPLAPLAAYYPSPDQPVLLLSHNPANRSSQAENSRHVLTVGWRAETSSAEGLVLPEELPKRLERLLPFLPGRWELVPQDEATRSPVRHRPIQETDSPELTLATGVQGLVSAAHHPLPGMATTASLTLGVAAAEALLREP